MFSTIFKFVFKAKIRVSPSTFPGVLGRRTSGSADDDLWLVRGWSFGSCCPYVFSGKTGGILLALCTCGQEA